MMDIFDDLLANLQSPLQSSKHPSLLMLTVICLSDHQNTDSASQIINIRTCIPCSSCLLSFFQGFVLSFIHVRSSLVKSSC